MLTAHRRSSRPVRLAGMLLLALLTVALMGCASLGSSGKDDHDPDPQAPEILAAEGMAAFNSGRYRKALKIFQEIRDRYPFSSVGPLAELKLADANFQLRRYQEAHGLYQEFENNHPTNEAIPYVLFQMGMSHYQRIGTVDRDPAHAINAIAVFTRLNRAFPDSPYAVEADARIMAARDFLARHEMYVAVFFVKTKEYDQAVGRLRYLQDTYPESNVAPQAGELLAAIEAGNPPTRRWRDWLPDLSLESWGGFFDALSPGVSAGDSSL